MWRTLIAFIAIGAGTFAHSASAENVLWTETITVSDTISAQKMGSFPEQGPVWYERKSKLYSSERASEGAVAGIQLWEEETILRRPTTAVYPGNTAVYTGEGEDKRAALASVLRHAVQYTFGAQVSRNRILESTVTTSSVARELETVLTTESVGYIHSWDIVAVATAKRDSELVRMQVSVTTGRHVE
jgi:hypothetical protein